MISFKALVLIVGALYPQVSYASETSNPDIPQVIGVSPSDQHLYQPVVENGVKKWHCLGDPSIVLTYDQINDDFCDCPDGSDEPGTNACPSSPDRLFYCANINHIPGHLETFKLNDGTCDYEICCDGSDEYLSGNCPDKCIEIHEQFEEYRNGVTAEVEESLKVKQKMIDEAKKIAQIMINKVVDVKQSIASKEQEVDEINQRILNGEGEEEDEEAGESVLDKIEPFLSQLSSKIESYSTEIAAQKKRIEYLENNLSKLNQNYNPNFNDAAVKESVKGYQEYVSNKVDSEYETSESSSEIFKALIEVAQELSYNPNDILSTPQQKHVEPTFSNMAQYYFEMLTKPQIKREEDVSQSTKKSSSDLNRALDEAESEIRSLKTELDVYEEDLTKDYGPDGILRAASSSWVDGSIGEYRYKLGFLNSIYQDNILIGTYTKYEDGKLYYENGHKCWNGPHRSAVVELICGTKNQFLAVNEPEKCEYHFEVISPIACEEFSDDELLANFKIDYSKL